MRAPPAASEDISRMPTRGPVGWISHQGQYIRIADFDELAAPVRKRARLGPILSQCIARIDVVSKECSSGNRPFGPLPDGRG